MHSEGTLNLHHKAVGLPYRFCRKASCNRILERFLLVEGILGRPKRTIFFRSVRSGGIAELASFLNVH